MFTLSLNYLIAQNFCLKIIQQKNSLFGVTNIVKNNDKDKWVYSVYGIAFDRGDCWSFGKDHHMLTISENNFLILGLGPNC